MTERHGRAHGEFLRYRCDSGQHEQTLNVCVIGSLHVVGCEHQVISHPHGVETIGLGLERPVETFFHRGVLAKMRQQQSEFPICHRITFSPLSKGFANPSKQILRRKFSLRGACRRTFLSAQDQVCRPTRLGVHTRTST